MLVGRDQFTRRARAGRADFAVEAAVSAADFQVGRPLLWALRSRRAEDCPPYRWRFLDLLGIYTKICVLGTRRH